MAWTEAARAAAAEVRKRNARGLASARKHVGTPEGLKKLRDMYKHSSRYQMASALKSARSGGHWAQPKLMAKAVKEGTAAQVYRNAMRARGVSVSSGSGITYANFKSKI